MKKIFATLFCAVVAALAICGFSACAKGENKTAINVYAPDGAPALALAQLMYEENGLNEGVSYHIVDSGTLPSRISADDEKNNADIIIMPVNMASKLLNDGSKYKMLGTVTHGNLFILANKNAAQLTRENFAESISGKKLGVINLTEFPGVMLKTLLSDYSVSAELSQVIPSDVAGTNVNYDYFLVPEPAASTRVGNAATELAFVGNVQDLYGESGYPQAVVMAKTSLIEDNPGFISDFMNALTASAEWIMRQDVTSEMILTAIKNHYPDPENTAPAFNNLSKEVISHCAVRFENSASCKENVKSLLVKLKSVNGQFAMEVGDNFFYIAS